MPGPPLSPTLPLPAALLPPPNSGLSPGVQAPFVDLPEYSWGPVFLGLGDPSCPIPGYFLFGHARRPKGGLGFRSKTQCFLWREGNCDKTGKTHNERALL